MINRLLFRPLVHSTYEELVFQLPGSFVILTFSEAMQSLTDDPVYTKEALLCQEENCLYFLGLIYSHYGNLTCLGYADGPRAFNGTTRQPGMTMGLSYLRGVGSATACRKTWLLNGQRPAHRVCHLGAPGLWPFPGAHSQAQHGHRRRPRAERLDPDSPSMEAFALFRTGVMRSVAPMARRGARITGCWMDTEKAGRPS